MFCSRHSNHNLLAGLFLCSLCRSLLLLLCRSLCKHYCLLLFRGFHFDAHFTVGFGAAEHRMFRNAWSHCKECSHWEMQRSFWISIAKTNKKSIALRGDIPRQQSHKRSLQSNREANRNGTRQLSSRRMLEHIVVKKLKARYLAYNRKKGAEYDAWCDCIVPLL